jgi:hypothetical protein
MTADSELVAGLRDHVTVNLRLVGALLALPGDELERFILREHALRIVKRHAPLIAGGLYAPHDAASRAALELAAMGLPT